MTERLPDCRLLSRLFTFCLFLLISGGVKAGQTFLVIGSYANESAARVEGHRISERTASDVLLQALEIQGQRRFRLLIEQPQDAAATLQLQQRLADANVAAPWRQRFADDTPFMETLFADIDLDTSLGEQELAEIDAMLAEMDASLLGDDERASDTACFGNPSQFPLGADYAVAGSFRSEATARRLASQLGDVACEISVLSTDIQGETYFRVLAGPIAPGQASLMLGALQAIGVSSPWVLRDVSTQREAALSTLSELPESMDRATVQPAVNRTARRYTSSGSSSAVTEAGNYDGDYNPARLNKAAGFPDPRQKK